MQLERPTRALTVSELFKAKAVTNEQRHADIEAYGVTGAGKAWRLHGVRPLALSEAAIDVLSVPSSGPSR